MRDSPAFRDALKDPALRSSAAFFVYAWCDEHLDSLEFRFVKHSVLERELSLSDTRISAAMALLVSRGYLDVGPRQGRMLSYRLYHSRCSRDVIPVPIPHQTGKAETR